LGSDLPPHARRQGRGDGRHPLAGNRGIRQARSNLIALLDQDDIWYPDHVEILLERFVEAKAARKIPLGWVYANLDEMDERGNIVSKGVLRTTGAHPK